MEIKSLKSIIHTFDKNRINQYLVLLSQLTNVFSNELEKRMMIENFSLNINNLDDNINIFVVIDSKNNKIVGTGTVILEKKIIHNFGKVGHIEDIVISQEYRGKGIGRKIINHLFEFCKTNNCYKILLDCVDENVNFYQKCLSDLKLKKQNNLAFYL